MIIGIACGVVVAVMWLACYIIDAREDAQLRRWTRHLGQPRRHG